MNGWFVPRCLLRSIRLDELAASNTREIRKRAQFDEAITAELDNSFLLHPKETSTTSSGCTIYGDYDHSLHNPYEDDI